MINPRKEMIGSWQVKSGIDRASITHAVAWVSEFGIEFASEVRAGRTGGYSPRGACCRVRPQVRTHSVLRSRFALSVRGDSSFMAVHDGDQRLLRHLKQNSFELLVPFRLTV